MKSLSFTFVAFVLLALGYNVYQANENVGLSELALENIEALSSYETNCIEWVRKECYDRFGNEHDPFYFYVTCSGQSTTSGGMLECGAVNSLKLLVPWQGRGCLGCVRY